MKTLGTTRTVHKYVSKHLLNKFMIYFFLIEHFHISLVSWKFFEWFKEIYFEIQIMVSYV